MEPKTNTISGKAEWATYIKCTWIANRKYSITNYLRGRGVYVTGGKFCVQNTAAAWES